jgi:hypothetical protein
MTGMSKTFAITVAIVLFVITVLILVPVFLRGRFKPATNSCTYTLGRIDEAKRQWALQYGKTGNDIPTWEAIWP